MIVPTLIAEYRSKRDEDYIVHYMRMQIGRHRVLCTFEEGVLVPKSLRYTHAFEGFADRLSGFSYIEVGKPVFYSLYEEAPDELAHLICKQDEKFYHYDVNENVIPILYAYYYRITGLTFK